MKYYTINQAAARVGISPITVRWHIQVGNIKAHKFGRDWMISEANIHKLIANSRQKKETK